MTEEKKEYILNALDEIEDGFIAEAAEYQKPKFVWKYTKEVIAVAACAAVLFISVNAVRLLPVKEAKEAASGAAAPEGFMQEAAMEDTTAVTAENSNAMSQDKLEYKAEENALWQFSHRLLSENIEAENPVLSPASAYLALGMVGYGAEGETLEEFQNVMGSDLQVTADNMIRDIPTWIDVKQAKQYDKDSQLLVANSVWIDKGMKTSDVWLKNVTDIYQAEVYQGQLSSKGVQKDINKWVDKKTHSLIQNFLDQPLPADTMLALFNTVYFKGEWQTKFEERSTYVSDFHAETGIVQTDMMKDFGRNEYYIANQRMDGVVMDYRYGSMAMVALKPTAGQTVRELFSELTYEEMNQLLDSGENRQMNLKLPKFEVEFDRILNESLINMGLERAFDSGLAEFGGLGQSENGNGLCIDLVRQKAVVKVDEEGTEAAAVTEVVMKEGMALEPAGPMLEVFFDEPFFYMIMDMESRTPLFMGILDNPSELVVD